jgi:hypothetical protein
MKKIDIDLKQMIEENDYQIMILEDLISDRDVYIYEAYGDLAYDATIAFDPDYLDERFQEEVQKIDKGIEEYKQQISRLKKENAFLKALLKV